jgi:hypothetical protein
MEYTLSIKSDKCPLTVTWPDVDKLSLFANLQSGFYLQDSKSLEKELLLQNFQQWNQMFWNQRATQGMFDLPNGSTIIDIGSGIAVVDLLLYSYIPNSTFYLVDKVQRNLNSLGDELPKTPFLENNYPFYNDWDIVTEAIKASGFDQERFKFLQPSDQFPEDVDAITSYFSWCFHYPKETYWDRAMYSLKKGGKLILDIRPLHEKDVIEEISEQIGSKPVKFAFPALRPSLDTYKAVTPGVSGYRCMWIK